MSDRDNHENAASRSREAAVYERGWADAIRAATNAIRRIPAANGGQSDMRGAAAVVVEALRPPAPRSPVKCRACMDSKQVIDHAKSSVAVMVRVPCPCCGPPAPEPTMEPALRAPMSMALEGAKDADWHGDEAAPSETAAPCCPRKGNEPHWGGCLTWSVPARVATERAATCTTCDGSGWLPLGAPLTCDTCDGTGRARGGAK